MSSRVSAKPQRKVHAPSPRYLGFPGSAQTHMERTWLLKTGSAHDTIAGREEAICLSGAEISKCRTMLTTVTVCQGAPGPTEGPGLPTAGPPTQAFADAQRAEIPGLTSERGWASVSPKHVSDREAGQSRAMRTTGRGSRFTQSTEGVKLWEGDRSNASEASKGPHSKELPAKA